MSVRNVEPETKDEKIRRLLFELSELFNDSDAFKKVILDEITKRVEGGKAHKNRTRRLKRNAKQNRW